MALWGNKDLVYNDGTIAVNFNTKQVTGTAGVVTFTTSSSGISTGNVITVGAGATFGYAVITGGITSTTMNIDSTSNFVVGLTTVNAGASYLISEEPIYNLNNAGGIYYAPESKSTGFSTSPVISGMYGVSEAEQQEAVDDNSQYKPAHAGWVGITSYFDQHGNLRVKTETFVASSSITGDADDDPILPDS